MPIGLDLGGRTAPEIALAILAEIIASRYGGTGRPMALAKPAQADLRRRRARRRLPSPNTRA